MKNKKCEFIFNIYVSRPFQWCIGHPIWTKFVTYTFEYLKQFKVPNVSHLGMFGIHFFCILSYLWKCAWILKHFLNSLLLLWVVNFGHNPFSFGNFQVLSLWEKYFVIYSRSWSHMQIKVVTIFATYLLCLKESQCLHLCNGAQLWTPHLSLILGWSTFQHFSCQSTLTKSLT